MTSPCPPAYLHSCWGWHPGQIGKGPKGQSRRFTFSLMNKSKSNYTMTLFFTVCSRGYDFFWYFLDLPSHQHSFPRLFRFIGKIMKAYVYLCYLKDTTIVYVSQCQQRLICFTDDFWHAHNI